jgi:S1-C subfamily serine protease
VNNEPDEPFSPSPGDDFGQTEEFPAQDPEGRTPGAGWGPHQPPPPPGFGIAQAGYQPGPGQVPPWWAHAPGQYSGEPAGGAYPPGAREAAWPRRRRGRGPVIAAGIAAVLAAGTVGGLLGHALGGSGTSSAGSSSAPPSANGGSGPGSGSGAGSGSGNGSGSPFGNGAGNGYGGGGFGGSGTGPNGGGTGPADASSIASRVDPGLVDVNTTIDYGAAEGAGTGMVLTSTGEVLTNNHVIDGATSISVTDVGNGRTYAATVVGYSVSADVAILRLSGALGLQTVTTSSAAASAGEEVVGIGNAGGSGGTPSYVGGTVTATNQSITANDQLTGTAENLTGMIATNANIESGDSGGPLVNASGRVIGMDTAGSGTFQFASQSGASGFAIPIGTASAIAGQITAGQSSSSAHVGATAFLGVQIGQPAGGFGPGSGFAGSGFAGSGSRSGVEISGVVSGGPAAGSGLAAGDVITAVGGHGVASPSSLQAVMVNDVKPGQTVTIQYTDTAGQQHTASLVLTSGPPS